ncbi:hypothetical protein BJ742DRAFT_769213 [Cladochytrium replicatum]|nr:hypothetical protein BJ742DRAFT_769213 [Cladochytrium replicatum]
MRLLAGAACAELLLVVAAIVVTEEFNVITDSSDTSLSARKYSCASVSRRHNADAEEDDDEMNTLPIAVASLPAVSLGNTDCGSCAGSGKSASAVGNAVVAEIHAKHSAHAEAVFLDLDDFHPPENADKMSAGTPLPDEDRNPCSKQSHPT